MMKNYIQNGDNLTVTAPADVVSGSGVLIGSLFGVATGDATTGDKVTLCRKGLFLLPKLSTQAWTVGVKVYWDAGNGHATTASSGNTLIGLAGEDAVNPSDFGKVILDGAAATS
jgi:predicted RecA/RadA family phage recombinase